MAAQIFPFGTALTVVWHLTKPDGTPFSLNGYSYHVYYKTGNKEIEANSSHLAASGNTLSIVIPAAEPVAPGEYAMRLVLRQNGNLFCTLNYNAAFVLSRQLAVDPAMQNQEQAGSVVHLYTVAEFYLLAPVVPVVGEDGFWWVNGARIVTPDGENVPADHSVRYDSTTKYLIIDEGRVDASGQSIQQTITDVADALADWERRYAEAEGSEDESEAGDGSRWGAFKAADASRQEYETSRQQAEGQGDYSSDPNSRRVKELARQTAETARQKAEGQLGNSDPDYAASRIKKELDRQKAEGQLGSGDADYADSRIKKEIDRQTAEGTPDDDPDDPTVLTRWAQYKRAVAATEAANTATDRANTAAEAAEHQVDVKRGYGIQSVTQPVVATTNGGVNTIRVTTEDGKTFDFQVRNGKSSAGFFQTAALLNSGIPAPNVGDYAFVSKAEDGSFPAYIYVCTTAGTWSATEAEYDGDSVDLTPYATKEQVNQLGQYIENPEWVKVVTDSEDKILFGVKADGKFYFGAGCPPQVQEYISIYGYDKDAVDAILATKVDKVTGKSLIDADFASAQKAEENLEWMDAKTDSEGRLLSGRDKNGELHEIVGVKTKKISASEYEFPSQLIDNLREDIIIGKYKPAEWYRQGLTYEAKGSTKLSPLVYKIPGNAYIGVVSYPDGTLFYTTKSSSEDPAHIVRVNKDGTQETLLTVSGNIRAFDFLWFDSHYNLYVSPPRCEKDETNANSGLYRLAYGADTFVHVLSLYDPDAVNPEARVMNYDCIREVTEDFNGNLYAGVYGGNPPERENPSLYKSTDGGLTWTYLVNLDYLAPGGKHIHAIEYNPYDNKLYCVVGEVNKLLRSADGGTTWEDCECTLELGKGFGMCIVPDGVLLGSDIGFRSGLSKVYGDLTFKTVAKTWFLAWPTFRVSDFTGWIYAFSRIDEGMTSELKSWPPREAISDPSVLQDWKDGDYTGGTAPSNLAAWEEYNAAITPYSPENAIRPTQTAVLVSRDFGESWEILLRINESDYDNATILSRSTGYFRNGEMSFTVGSNTFVISEGKHRYIENGVDCAGDVLIKLNGGTTIVNPIF